MAFQKDTLQTGAFEEGGDLKPNSRPLQPEIQNDGGIKQDGYNFEAMQPLNGGALKQGLLQENAFETGGDLKQNASGFESIQGYEGADKKIPADAFQTSQNNAFEEGAVIWVVDVTGHGIPSGEAFGSPDVAVSIGLTGIASAEAVGTPTIGVQIKMSGIPSAEVFGSLTVTVTAISDNAKNRGGREIRRDDWERKMERDRQEYDERERMYLMQDETDIMAIITKFLEVVE